MLAKVANKGVSPRAKRQILNNDTNTCIIIDYVSAEKVKGEMNDYPGQSVG